MLVSAAHAQAAGAAPAAGGLEAFIPLILIFIVFYFLLIRPQQKKMKQHKEMLSQVRRGDKIVTNGGLIGKVVKAADDELEVEIAENVKVKVVREMIATVVSKTEPVAGDKSGDKPAEGGKAEGLKGMLSGKK
ncbi:preprotein translocase subunit YajC [Roseospirillum parvum]|uniref:Sec translocon accessory complex subunit YajC n=1 Tax=Roseospirillum parvum TaxID=83401 RepID=A0A1G7Y0R4_9PROT|nr:preprotein translocase subunit YajC [Roseospirillum parvum]SDG89923.1 preprotein translocase subunit YajC [Roseospirillum parvum]